MEEKDLTLTNAAPKTEQNTEKENVDFDYKQAERKDLVQRLTLIIDTQNPLDIKSEVETLKSVFYGKLAKEHTELKAAFMEDEAMEEEDFLPPKDELETLFKSELARYRKLKQKAYDKLEKERKENLKRKEELIEELKQLIEKEESLKVTFEAFHAIQERWRAIGAVPSSRNNDLWQTYHLHVEHFYDYIKINKDLRDLDFKRNKEKKEFLCEKAEQLAEHKSVIEAFKILQLLHQEWKETGPVSRELREPLWNRFKEATSKVNKRHQTHFAKQKEKQLENLKKKEALCEKVEAIANAENATAKEWNKNVERVQQLQEEWRTVGQVPQKENSAIYRRFRKGCDAFFKRKREFYKHHKNELVQNLELKKALVEKALALQDSEDWKETTEALIALQKEWKKIGPVPQRQSERIWNKFRKSCNTFFERKENFYGESKEQQIENQKLKEAIIENIKAFSSSDSPQEDIKTLLRFKEEWQGIGHVPIGEKNKINDAFRKAIDTQFDQLKLDKDEREMQKFRSRLSDLNEANEDAIFAERKKLSLRLKELETEIARWENNIGFLSKSKSTEALVKEYTERIEKAKQQKILLTKKIRLIDAV